MSLRTAILRTMLWALGLAAGTGVLSVFLQSRTTIWRVLWTELCAAVACALVIPCIPMIDRAQTRAGGLLGMGGVVVQFLLALTLIWELPSLILGVDVGIELAATMVIFGLVAVSCVALLPQMRHPTHGASSWAAIVTVCTSGVAFLLAVWGPGSAHLAEQWVGSGSAVLVVGLLVALSLLGLGAPQRRTWRWVGVGAAGVAGAMWLFDIWVGRGSDLGFVIFCGMLAAAAVVAYWIVCCLCPLRPGQFLLRNATMIAALLTAVLIELLIAGDRLGIMGLRGSVLERCAAASGIVTACGTLAIAVVARIARSVEYEPEGGPITDISVVCPRCRTKQAIAIPQGRCGSCQLRISIKIEEPRCPGCNYLLYGLTSDRCPECGRTIADTVSSAS